MSKFSERIKKIRTHSGFTQKEFASMLEIGERAYQYYESGTREPTSNKLLEISLKLGVPAGYLLGQNNGSNQNSSLSDRLKKLRLKENNSKDLVSAAIDVPFGLYVAYEEGEFEPTISDLISLSAFYNVSIDYLLGLTDNPKRY